MSVAFCPHVYVGLEYPNSALVYPCYWVPNFSYWNSVRWSENVGIPNYERYKKLVGNPVKSWALCSTIWTPTLQDSFPPEPLLIHSFRPMDDDSILMDIFNLSPKLGDSNNE